MKLIVLVKVIDGDYEEFENLGVFDSVELSEEYVINNFLFPFKNNGEMFAYPKFDGGVIEDNGVFRRPIKFLSGGCGMTTEEPIRFLFEEFTLITKKQDLH